MTLTAYITEQKEPGMTAEL